MTESQRHADDTEVGRSARRRRGRVCIALVSLVLLAACSGGVGAESDGAAPAPDTDAPAPDADGGTDATGGTEAAGGTEAGGTEAGEVTTVTFANWATVEEATAPGLDELIAAFEEENPDIQVEMSGIAFSDIAQQVLRQARSGNAPDIVELAGNDTLSLAEAGILAPLDDLAGEDFEAQIIPEVFELGLVEDQVLGVPWTVAPFGLWYNRDIMEQAGLDPEQPPTNTDELLEALAAVQTALPDVIPLGADTTNRPFGLDANWPLMASFEAQPFEGSEAMADTPGMRAYLEFMRTLANEGYTEVNQPIGYFRPIAADGNVAFTIDGPYVQGVVTSTAGISPEEFADTWGVTAPPAAPEGENVTVPTDHQLSILADSENQEAAWELIEFLSTSEQAVTEYTLPVESSLPPLAEPEGAISDALEGPVYQSIQEEVIPTVVRPPWGANYAAASSPVMAAVQTAMTSDTPIDQIVTDLQGQLEAVLQ